MKSLLVIALVFLIGSYGLEKTVLDEYKKQIQGIGQECLEKIQASEDDIGRLMVHQMPETHEGKCLIFCMHRKLDMVNEDGTPNRDGTLVFIEKIKNNDSELYEKLIKMMDTCIQKFERNDDTCLSSASYAECGIKEGKELGATDVFSK